MAIYFFFNRGENGKQCFLTTPGENARFLFTFNDIAEAIAYKAYKNFEDIDVHNDKSKVTNAPYIHYNLRQTVDKTSLADVFITMYRASMGPWGKVDHDFEKMVSCIRGYYLSINTAINHPETFDTYYEFVSLEIENLGVEII